MSDHEMDAAFEAYRKRTFGAYGPYPVQSYTDFCVGWKAARMAPDCVLVPSTPTNAMLKAAQRAHADHSTHREWLDDEWPMIKLLWDAMLKVARTERLTPPQSTRPPDERPTSPGRIKGARRSH